MLFFNFKLDSQESKRVYQTAIIVAINDKNSKFVFDDDE